MHYKTPEDRNQLILHAQMDLWIGTDNSVRLLDKVIDKIIKDNPNEFIWKGQNKKGCTSYSPSTMCKLLLYCYFNWISGSRRMEKETYRNLELIWLLGNLHPDHWTICAFRRENEKQIKFIATRFRDFLKDSGYIQGKTIAVDGSKMKAYASPDMFSQESIVKRLDKIEQQIEKYLESAEEVDNLEEQLIQEQQEKRELQEKVEKLQIKKKKLENVREQLKSKGKKYISPNDPDANLMKGRDGKKACYNVQSATDSKHHMLVIAEATTDENDLQQLKTNHKKIVEQNGFEPEKLLADKGYYNTKHIKDIEEEYATKCYIPVPNPAKQKADKISGVDFKYDEQKDELICPENKRLILHAKGIIHSDQVYNQYKCHDCLDCPSKSKCTSSISGRTVKRNVDSKWINEFKSRMKNKQAKNIINERKNLVEHPFGSIKVIMGKHDFILTTIEKVQIELDLYSTAYNLKRLLNIENTQTIINKIETYNWKVAA